MLVGKVVSALELGQSDSSHSLCGLTSMGHLKLDTYTVQLPRSLANLHTENIQSLFIYFFLQHKEMLQQRNVMVSHLS